MVWRDIVHRGRPYRVVAVQRSGGNTTVEMEAAGRPLRHRRGQFAFVRFERTGLREPHPFTIASAPGEPVLRFVIRDLGDWTARLARTVRPDDKVLVEGPYGRLALTPRARKGRTVWIAGGVGITPFLGAACTRRPDAETVPHLYYCMRTREDAAGLQLLEDAAREGRITLSVCVSSEGSRLDASTLRADFGDGGLAGAHVVMCGPAGLVRAMRPVLRDLGAHRVHIEQFDMRGGIGPDLSREIDTLLRAGMSRTR